MRVAFTADSQVDETSRLEEHDRVMDFIVADADRRGCVPLLHGGDVYERRSTATERRAVDKWLRSARNRGMDVFIAGGNHEAAGEVEELRVPSEVRAEERPCVIEMDEFMVAVLPWPRRANLAAWLRDVRGAAPSAEATDATAREMLRDILRGFADYWGPIAPTLPRILLAHVEIEGYVTDSDQPACGGGMRVSVEDLMLAEADIVLCGHVHRPQAWVGTRADGVQVPVIYAGSPRRTSYSAGELVEKGYVVVTFAGRVPTWERVPTPATPMVLVTGRYADGLVLDAPPGVLVDAEIRLRYTTPGDRRAEAARAADLLAQEWLDAGASEVKVEESVEPTTRARGAEIAAAPTLTEKLRALWAMRGDLDDARRDRLVGLAAAIEEATP